MKKTVLVGVGLIISFFCFSQDFSNCFNGVKDSLENGVDCYTNTSGKGRMLCNICNGSASVNINGKNYNTGIVTTSVAEVPSPTIFLDKSSANISLMPRFFTDGSTQSGFTLMFVINANPVKVGEYKLKSITKSPFKFIIWYHKSNAIMQLHKIKSGAFEVTAVDNIERKLNATFTVDATLSDGTPINLEGTFTNVGY
jgi:hypothetical protein